MKPASRTRPARDAARRQSGRKGAVVVELALMLPFLALMLVVIADLGLVLREHQILANAAREGARFSALDKNWVSPQNPTASFAAIRTYILDYCDRSGVDTAGMVITIDQSELIPVPTGTASASRVRVTVNRNMLFPAAGLLDVPSLTLTAEAVFRNFHPGGASG